MAYESRTLVASLISRWPPFMAAFVSHGQVDTPNTGQSMAQYQTNVPLEHILGREFREVIYALSFRI